MSSRTTSRAAREDEANVLVACPDAAYAALLARHIEVQGRRVERCLDSKSVLRLVNRGRFAIVLLDLGIGDETSVDLVSFIRRRSPDTQVILLFDMARVDRALEGIRRGAYFYLPKSCQPGDVALAVEKALRKTEADAALTEYEQSLFEEMAGATPAMRRVIEVIAKVAPTDSTVLLLGESGTGKEVLAHAIHRLSSRRDMPFIAINCAALPETLLESEIFGHVKGSFTGADADKRGLFEEADGGTVFMDEIGDMSPVTQAKLLRVLQNGEIRPVGATVARRVDVRVIAATNRDLTEAVRTYAFREDLYFRLNVIQIRIPPLRERLDALAPLIAHFLKRFNAKFGRNIRTIDDQAQMLLRNYAYPGNVRELESIVAHAAIMAEGDTIHPSDLPDSVRYGQNAFPALPNYSANQVPSRKDMEEQMIRAALKQLGGNRAETARQLGISRSTLWRKMKEFKIAAENA